MRILTANVKRDVDLSLYLVTGRDLLPHGMVLTFLFSLLLQVRRSFDLQSHLTSLEEVSNHFVPQYLTTIYAGSSGWCHRRTSPRKERRHWRGALPGQANSR